MSQISEQFQECSLFLLEDGNPGENSGSWILIISYPFFGFFSYEDLTEGEGRQLDPCGCASQDD